jgi:hypothetical protein
MGDLEWVASPETTLPGVAPGRRQIDPFSIDGATAEGTATFVEANAAHAAAGGTGDPVTPVTGSSEVTCGG